MRLMLMSSTQDPESGKKNADDESYNHENSSDHAADFSRLCCSATAWIHCSRIHFLQVSVSHHPGCNANWLANHQPQNAKNQNKCATMWFHRVIGFRSCFLLETPVQFRKLN